MKIKTFKGSFTPLELHKVRIVQKLNYPTLERRAEALREAGNNMFLLKNDDIFLDMLTDSGVNAMSDNQVSAMLRADDSYAGSATYFRLEKTVLDFFNKDYFLPAHQGRACEHILAKVFVNKGHYSIMNYHFTTTKAHITELGGIVVQFYSKDALKTKSNNPFKGNMDLEKLEDFLSKNRDLTDFVRMEAGTNLIGGQPWSLENLVGVHKICRNYNIPLILDASLLADNLYFIKEREEACKHLSIKQILTRISDLCDIIYFSARKLSFSRGGGIVTSVKEFHEFMKPLVPLYEGFLTYGGMSVREMEAMAVGLEETLDEDIISQGPLFIKYMVESLDKLGVPVVTPAGGLGCHLDVKKFLPDVDSHSYPAEALACALYLISGIRGMERGTLSEQRDENGVEEVSDVELLRLALPRRVFTLSQVKFAVDRIYWLYQHKNLIGGLKWVEEPKVLRFFYGILEPSSNWQELLIEALRKDLGTEE
ncbi:MAG: tryptophanase [Acholeplasmatales bacterium]|jgi:tryptophanase|nr:tryptophanase [Acholeplasmatales bacterium]